MQGYNPVVQPRTDFDAVTSKEAQGENTVSGTDFNPNNLPGIGESGGGDSKPDPLQTSSIDPYTPAEDAVKQVAENVVSEPVTSEPEQAPAKEAMDFTYEDPVDRSIKTLPEEYHSIQDKKLVDDIKQKFIHERMNAAAMPYLNKTLEQLKEGDKKRAELESQLNELQEKDKQRDIYKKLGKSQLLDILMKEHQITKGDLDNWLDDDNNLEVGDEHVKNSIRNKRQSWQRNYDELVANHKKDAKIAELEKKLSMQDKLNKQMEEQRRLNDTQKLVERVEIEVNNNDSAKRLSKYLDKNFEPGRFINEVLFVGQEYAKNGLSISPKDAINKVVHGKFKPITDQLAKEDPQDKKMLFPPTQQTNGAYVGDSKTMGFNVFDHAKNKTAQNYGGLQ